jgi:hypothetical protein
MVFKSMFGMEGGEGGGEESTHKGKRTEYTKFI